ncbi:MAG TPA: class I SAM-dependent methyltransferase [Spirillospora sp.]|nr:class I SAM-dependent methyltransferase [Spirillospora sp.]
MPEPRPRICDYEGSNYRIEFWESKDRNYEDRVERVALRRLLPLNGKRLLEIGAGFGRLTSEYTAFDQVVVMDYSLSQLQYAQEHLGRSGRYIYVAADAYRLPFQDGVFDAATMIRVLHHMADVPAVLDQIRRVLVTDASFILEFASKRHIKAIGRYLLRRQTWNPFDHEPVEFVELNFDFHPAYIRRELNRAGFEVLQQIPVSFFRAGLFKKLLPTDALVAADSLLQHSGLLYTPSIFAHALARGTSPDNLDAADIFQCPESGEPLRREGDTLVCDATGVRWAIRDGIYDFKAPLD